jgi:cytochrome c biogenesis protein CcmG/thiol:disulfide interchange protein DsbE
VPTVVIVIAAALVALLVYGVVSKQDNRSIDAALAQGRSIAAPDRSLPVLGGAGTRSLADYRGRVVVLNFWASWCDPCHAEAPVLERVQRSIQAHGATVVGVTFQDATPDSLAFVHQYRITYPSLRDVGGDLAQAYGTHALPETFIIDRQGRIVAGRRSAVDPTWLRSALRPLLSQRA